MGGYQLIYSPTSVIASSSSPVLREAMSGVFAKRFDKNGYLTEIVSIESWYCHKGETTTQMIEPALKIYTPDGNQWKISAEKGLGFQATIGGKLDKLQLSENVVIYQQGKESHKWWKLKTEQMVFFPKTPMALTDEPLTVTAPGLQTHAVGMRAYLDKHHVEFLKDVITHYARQ